jgi:hydroxymethylpyrimidine/phosphomethylpyrimidine kinase
MRTALTIAGSDSMGGAGIQADLKTFAALGIYGASAITAVTAQSTGEVAEVVALSPHMVRAQIDAVLHDADVAAVKTGMLASREIVEVVADALGCEKEEHALFLVVDPVMSATHSAKRTLLPDDGVSTMASRLLPMATVVTPNVAEAEALSGTSIRSLAAAREAAKCILGMGPAAVVLNGGHRAGPEAIDLLLHDGVFTELAAPRSGFADVHGTGCTFASAIAARLALGDDIPAAVHRAKQYVTGAIAHSVQVGRGARILNHFWELSL